MNQKSSSSFKVYTALISLVVVTSAFYLTSKSDKSEVESNGESIQISNRNSPARPNNSRMPSIDNKIPSQNTDPLELIHNVIANRNNISSDEFNSQMNECYALLKNATYDQIVSAISMLPPGNESMQAFNSISFILFEKYPELALSHMAELQRNKIFPADWIYTAVDPGISILAHTDSELAARISLGADEIFPSELGKARLFGRVLNYSPAENSDAIIQLIESTANDRLLKELSTQEALWAFALKNDKVDEINRLLNRKKLELGTDSMVLIGKTVGNNKGFNEGFDLIGNNFNGNLDAYNSFYNSWFVRDPNLALQELSKLPQNARDLIIYNNIQAIALWDSDSAVKWANTITDHSLRVSALHTLGQ